MIQNEKSDCIHWSHLEHLSQEHKQKGMFKHSATKLFENIYIYTGLFGELHLSCPLVFNGVGSHAC